MKEYNTCFFLIHGFICVKWGRGECIKSIGKKLEVKDKLKNVFLIFRKKKIKLIGPTCETKKNITYDAPSPYRRMLAIFLKLVSYILF